MSYSSLAVAKYMVGRAQESGEEIPPQKLLKLVYIAHGWMLGIHGRHLISETAEAWKYGPIIRELHNKVRDYRGKPVPLGAFSNIADTKFDSEERELMDEVWDAYKGFSGVQLSSMTHQPGTPWEIIWNSNNNFIPDPLIQNYYEKLASDRANRE